MSHREGTDARGAVERRLEDAAARYRGLRATSDLDDVLRRAARPSDAGRRSSSGWRRAIGLLAAGIVVALLLADRWRRTTSESPPPMDSKAAHEAVADPSPLVDASITALARRIPRQAIARPRPPSSWRPSQPARPTGSVTRPVAREVRP